MNERSKSIGKNVDVELELSAGHFKATKKKPYTVTVKDYNLITGMFGDVKGSGGIYRKFFSSEKVALDTFDKLKKVSDVADFINTADYESYLE